ncbi:MAG: hypothetical protein IRY88_05670 [Rubrobacteraceae bacterium]|uniref:hypothetical protein n=1 Tax=Rubrobacter naiadicus TaxID=1392641 RepID=UPI00235F60F9|nr:hypothetical protein [Rubrobacter naiadicus]MBX6763157.1 hypothetical protein [Rubrobacteraceae bacterium]
MRRGIGRGYLAVPGIEALTPEDVRSVPRIAGAVSYWSGHRRGDEWLREVLEEWGQAGFTARKDGELLGFALYGPRSRLVRVEEYPIGPLEEGRVFLAYAEGDARIRRHLLVRVLGDLKGRGVGGVDAIASDLGTGWHLPTRFLLECGWRPVRQGWKGGQLYTLVRTDLASSVEVRELARGLLGRVKMPSLKPRGGLIPGTLTRSRPASEHLEKAGTGCGYIA